jgi:hypothetical protein
VRSASDAAASEDEDADYAAPRLNMASFSDLAAVTGQTVTPTATAAAATAASTAYTAAAAADSSADEPDYTHVAEQLLAPAGGGSPRGGWAPGASPSMRGQGADSKHRAHFAESFGDSEESEHEYSEDFEAVPSPVKATAAVQQQQQQQQQYSSQSDSSPEQQLQQQTVSVQDAFGRGVTQLTVARSDFSPQQQQQRADAADNSDGSHDYGADDTFESDSADDAAATTAGTVKESASPLRGTRGRVLEFADLDTVAVGSSASHRSGASPVVHFTNSSTASASTAAAAGAATAAAGGATAGDAASTAYRRTSAVQTQQQQQQQQQQQPSLLLPHSAAAAVSPVPLGSASVLSTATTAAAAGVRSSRSVTDASQQQQKQQQRTARGVLLERSRDAVIEEPIHKV